MKSTTMEPYVLLISMLMLLPSNIILLVCADNKIFTNAVPSNIHWNASLSNLKPSVLLEAPTRDPHEVGSSEIGRTLPLIFQTQFNMTFPVVPGPNFIRLHFVPISDSLLNVSKAVFSVTVGRYILLDTSKFLSSSKVSHTLHGAKEFCLNINSHMLNLTFFPSPDVADAFAFVNKVDVVSVPEKLYMEENVRIPFLGHHSGFYGRNSVALETMHRITVGGNSIFARHDSGGLSRTWVRDDDFLIPYMGHTYTEVLRSNVQITYGSQTPPYAAPVELYATARTASYNMAWSFPVESSFCYLVRLHFCEISAGIIQQGRRDFLIFINNQTAEDHADVNQWSGGEGIPVFRDYVLNISDDSQGIIPLQITVQGSNKSTKAYLQPILNGVEIFKLSNGNKSLAGSNPFTLTQKDSHDRTMNLISWGIKGTSLSLFIVSIIGSFIYAMRTSSPWPTRTSSPWQSSATCKQFLLSEMKSATNNFSDANIIGAGGFGKVYKGNMDFGETDQHHATTLAIKRASSGSNQGLKEFQAEILTLSRLRHRHLVSLLGYCTENKEMILAYDYMPHGTLRDHLYGTKKSPLPWKQRLRICIGAAKGLAYLHNGTREIVIHRDVKSTNILLDRDWVAKVSDFGLSKVQTSTTAESKTHVSIITMVKGSFGYLDPEYYKRQKLTEKSDVYSFGVVLFEVLCARPAVLPLKEFEDQEEHEKVNLAEWVSHCFQTGTIEQIIDTNLEGQIAPECFNTFTGIARKCLADRGSERPSMGALLWNLELAMKQQESAEAEMVDLEQGCAQVEAYRKIMARALAVTVDGQICARMDNSDLSPGVEFSEIIVPAGR